MGSINVTNLGKAYKQYPTRWSRLREWLTPGKHNYHQTKWVLQDINFAVQPGEAVGIIGINGAGKSTLLKLITGTTQPTTGIVQMTGRVAAMLELGMGFHPDFTGRQNVFMAGQLLGISSEDIAKLMPEIESFADIGIYLDQPVRIYSSGMQVRLAFSVATCVRPDILIVDEALSVGDIQFQQKCMSRIRGFRKLGTTILLVTHDIGALGAICDRAIVLSNGRIRKDGPVSDGIEQYFASMATNSNATENQLTETFATPDKYIEAFDIDCKSNNKELWTEGERVRLRFKMKGLEGISDPHVGIRIQDRFGLIAYETNTFCQSVFPRQVLKNLNLFELSIELDVNLGKGEYTLSIGIESDGQPGGVFAKVIMATQHYHSFSVTPAVDGKQWAGSTNLMCAIEVMNVFQVGNRNDPN